MKVTLLSLCTSKESQCSTMHSKCHFGLLKLLTGTAGDSLRAFGNLLIHFSSLPTHGNSCFFIIFDVFRFLFKVIKKKTKDILKSLILKSPLIL